MVERVIMTIRGRVQGVGFRYASESEAERLGISGWVRNRRNGNVEIVAEGERAALEIFVAWCRSGPPGAEVDDVWATWGAATDDFGSFEVLPTE